MNFDMCSHSATNFRRVLDDVGRNENQPRPTGIELCRLTHNSTV